MAETFLFLINASTLLSLSYLAAKFRPVTEGREWLLVPALSGLAAILLMLQPLPGIGPMPDVRFLPVVLTALRYGLPFSLLSSVLPMFFSWLVMEADGLTNVVNGLLMPALLGSALHRSAYRDLTQGIRLSSGIQAAAALTSSGLLIDSLIRWSISAGSVGSALLLFAVSSLSLTTLLLLHNEENRNWISQRRLEMKANQDNLTGLPNLRSFLDIASCSFCRERISIFMIDIDNFKKYNDRWGHVQGDLLLASVGRRMQELIPERDYIARYGGEEFIIVCHETETDELAAIASRLCKEIARLSPGYRDGEPEGSPDVSISIGVAVADKPAGNLLVLIEQADEALYISKHTGKNKHTFYQETALAQVDPA